MLGFNDTSTLEGHFVSSPREREKRDRRESRGDEREGQGRKRNRNESEETEEIKTFPLYPYPLQGAISPLFYNILLPVVDFHVKTGTIFSLRDKRLLEISEVEISRVKR